jgi:tRNA(His) 5'-end guanylyltransferase
MKSYEAITDIKVSTDSPVILRLDGHTFSKFTAHFARPFDPRIHSAMVSTCTDLLHFLPTATLAYTQSDEITLVCPRGLGCFNDRVQKVGSLAAAYTSVRFNAHLSAAVSESPEPAVRNAETVLGSAYFDARVFAVPSVEEALNCLLWRCRGDAVRNSVNAFARTLFSMRELHGKNCEEVLEMMRAKGVVYEEAVPSWAVEGSTVKREQYEHVGRNLKTAEEEVTSRSRAKVVDRGVRTFSEENLRLVVEKYWEEV